MRTLNLPPKDFKTMITKEKNPGLGGKRPNSGRKKKAATILREMLEKEEVKEAKKSFHFCVLMRDNEDAPDALRLAAAVEIMNRVLGKPKQAHEVKLKSTLAEFLNDESEDEETQPAGDPEANS